MNMAEQRELAHLHAWELLPWIVNGRASEAEERLVGAHLRDCEQCRDELASQRRLQAAMSPRENAGGPDVERGLEHLWQRFDDAQAPAARGAAKAPLRTRMAALAAGLAVIALLEGGGLAMLGIKHGDADPPASYRTLSQPDAAVARATIRLVADPAMPVGQLQALLLPLHLQIVAGPGENGVYSLAPTATHADLAAQLAALRAAADVRFAEPVGDAAGGIRPATHG